MKLLMYLPLFLLAVATAATPTTRENALIVTRNFFLDTNVKYTGQHDIVNIVVPLNKVNFDDDDDERDDHSEEITIFFVEADVNDKGERQYQGLYVLKNGTATKILDNGRDATTFNDDSNKVYLAASDGIYVYDGTNGSTDKFGSLTDNIVQIEADNKTGIIYFLTNDHQVFFVADNATKKNKVDSIKDVHEIAVDFNGNLYYYDNEKSFYVVRHNIVKKYEGLPTQSEIKLLRPMFALEEGVFAIIDNVLYLLNPNGNASNIDVMFDVKPTAYAPEATLLQYYALDKKIYEFNVIQIITSKLEGLTKILHERRNEIQTIAKKSRSSFGASSKSFT